MTTNECVLRESKQAASPTADTKSKDVTISLEEVLIAAISNQNFEKRGLHTIDLWNIPAKQLLLYNELIGLFQVGNTARSCNGNVAIADPDSWEVLQRQFCPHGHGVPDREEVHAPSDLQ